MERDAGHPIHKPAERNRTSEVDELNLTLYLRYSIICKHLDIIFNIQDEKCDVIELIASFVALEIKCMYCLGVIVYPPT